MVSRLCTPRREHTSGSLISSLKHHLMEVFALLQVITLLFSLTVFIVGSWMLIRNSDSAIDKLIAIVLQPITGSLLSLWSTIAVITYVLSTSLFLVQLLTTSNSFLNDPIIQMVSTGFWLGCSKDWAGLIIGVNALALTGHFIFLTIKRTAF